ncbi:MAG: helix-turn-helix domain-containing protein [Nitrospirales bacterium]|nr:helix-turn-helix domain-containing protein [Nitrospirales bacterium]
MNITIELLTDEQVHKIYGVMPKTLANWRWRGVGPKFVKIGHQVRYRPEDLKAFLESRIFSSTTAYLEANGKTRKSKRGL